VLKTTTVIVLAVRYLRSNRRPAIAMSISALLVRVRILARRAHERWKLRLPAMLVSFRAALGPVMVLIGARWRSGTPLAVCIVMALASDAFDGILARRWQIDTETLRRWDTRADTFFYTCVLLAIILRAPQTIARHWVVLVALVGSEIGQHLFALFKYQRHASYHSILSKIWGLWMAAGMIALLGFAVDNWFLDFVFAWGILCNLQGFAMSLLLPEWQRDVPTLFHAWRLRGTRHKQLQGSTAPSRAWW